MRDLVALSTLPAVWIGLDLEGIGRSLAHALLATLSLDLIYIRLGTGGSGTPVEVIASKGKLDASQEMSARRALEPLADWSSSEPPRSVADPRGGGLLQVAVIRFGLGDDQGVLIACSAASDFPSEQDRLLLSVGANQTSVVAQRRLAEDRGQEQREWLRVTLSSIGDGVIATDIEGRVTFMNAVAEKLTGWPQADALGQPVDAVFVIADEESGRLLQGPLERAVDRGQAAAPRPGGVGRVLRARSGAKRAIDDSVAPIRNSAGGMIGVVVVFRSVDERRHVEQLRNTRLAVVQVLNQATNVQDATTEVLRTVCENLGWDAGYLWVADEDALKCRSGWYRPTKPLPHFDAKSRARIFRRGEGLPGRVWASGQPEWLSLTAENPHFPRIEEARRNGLRSGFACPVVVGERTIGAVEFFTSRPRSVDADLLEMMATLASNVGQFIERKAAEDELRRSEEELAEFFENASVGLHWVGPDGIIVRANRAELEMLGYEPDEYVGRSISDFHVDDEVICDILDKLKVGEKLAEYPARLRCKDGSIKHVLIDSSVMWKDGRFIHTRCFTRDVTARKEAEAALAAARSQLDAALSAGSIATWTWDIAENRLYADRRLALLFNLPPAAAGGESLDRFVEAIHPDDVQRVTAALAQAVETRSDYAADYRIIQADGSVRWVTARGRPECDAVGRPVRMPGVLVDITERKLLEEELRLRLGQLAEADRRKDEFLATLAHELRNPLAPIRNSLEILKMTRLDAAIAQQTRDIMERQVQHLVRLVDDLLDVSRVMRGKIDLRREPVELASVVARAVETAQPLIESQRHRLSLSLPEESLRVHGDPVRLTQVIGNLLANSAKYTEANGHIWLTARAEGAMAILSVKDDGIGIAPDLLPHVFELFVQADHSSAKAQGGLGIGLTLVKNLVELHGGSVEARSAGLGQGCEFVVHLPLAAHAAPQPRPDSPESALPSLPPTTGLRVLVIDDNRDAASSLATMLRLRGHDVRVAHDGPTGLATAAAQVPDLVFLDIGMPGMDGYEVARRLRAHPALQATVLAALTGWGQQEDRRRTGEAGFHHHLLKPPEPRAILSLLESLRRCQVAG